MTRPVTLSEPHFSQHTLNKYASLMAQGNGYLGLRASHEEDYTRQTRGMYLAGLYHRAGKGEINELVNLPDVVGMEIAINGEVFSLSHEAWQRELDFASGELRRNVVWRTSNGSGYTIASRLFVSADQLPLIALEITITPLDADASVLISTGIDATQTNHGRQHLDETQVRVFGQHLMQGSYTTQDGRSDVAISCCCKVSGDVQQCYTAKERRLLQHTSAQLHAGETMTLQKLVWIDWRDDRQAALDEWGSASLRQLEMCAQQSYDQLLAASTENWRQWWQKRRITVNGGEAHDQQALDYALYHLRIMTPVHDERSSIAAKGLTGEGYKGHIFWDTEVFLLPFHLFSDPTVARSLLRYRWHNLPGAQEKARRNGWQGALFPWESARSGEEETPEFAAINIRTGLRQKVASAQAEHHLVADIAWAVIQYWQTTGDESFIAHEGMALLLETAKFWISRAVRSLLRYRWHNLPGAQEKARRNGWQGALFPWESARSGEEETPEFAAINIRTGLRQKVASAQAEHHLVADIAWAVIQYWQTTGDESFIAHEGMALLLETAKFWISRAVRSLLRYRWHNLPGAQEKARRNGWQGALFPWESARSGEEETPEFAAINIRTGLRQKVASAQAEHHLVADIAWAVIQYWQTTGDESFIAHEGMALLLETAKFWISRAVRVNDRLEIHDVIGPDEYTEHVNNNAYTSYMARYNVQQALNIARQFGCSDDAFIHRAEMFLKELWMPEIQPDGVLPQDDSFMAKPAINLAKYKAAAGKQTILLDYSRAEVNEMQILKQADVVMLNYMLPEQFSAASCLANLQFYEPRTIHDSSLSKAIHGIVAARCGLLTQSYQFWREGTEIDLGADPHSCDDGIHAAATGAIWLGAIQGFAGVSVRDGELHLNPALPEQWQQLSFPLFWQGCELQVTLDAQRIAIRTSAPVSLRLNGQLITVAEESVFCLGDFILPFNGTATKHQEDE
ncbi:glycoside hydrolase family 65 protein [Escherichia coli]